MRAQPPLRGLPSRATARAIASRFAKPIARAAAVAAGLLLLAFIGHARLGEALGGPAAAAAPSVASLLADPAPSASLPLAAPSPPPGPPPAATTAGPTGTPTPVSSRVAATPDDPVILNTATADDLRRLPGIGEKRANAILALRARMGRLRAVEDLLKVKGIGRAMIKRLRPLVRVDPAPVPQDAGAGGATPPR